MGKGAGGGGGICVYIKGLPHNSQSHIQLAIQLANMDRLPPPPLHNLCQQCCYFRQRCQQNLQDDFFEQFSDQHLYPPIYDGPLINDEQMSKYDDRQRQQQLSPSPPEQLLVNEEQIDDRQGQQQPLVNEEQMSKYADRQGQQQQPLVNGEMSKYDDRQKQQQPSPEQPLVNEEQINNRQGQPKQPLVNGEQRSKYDDRQG